MPPSGTFGSYVRMDPTKLAELLRSPAGPVARRLIEDGELVKLEAQRLVGVGKPDPVPRKKTGRRPGTLRDSIVKRVASESGGIVVLVGSNDPIALIHHEGTEPHPIDAKNSRYLVFYWPKTGKVMYLKRVQHPGTRPNRYLTNALRVLAGRY